MAAPMLEVTIGGQKAEFSVNYLLLQRVSKHNIRNEYKLWSNIKRLYLFIGLTI